MTLLKFVAPFNHEIQSATTFIVRSALGSLGHCSVEAEALAPQVLQWITLTQNSEAVGMHVFGNSRAQKSVFFCILVSSIPLILCIVV